MTDIRDAIPTTGLPGLFEATAVFTRAGEFVRWIPDGLEEHPDYAPRAGEHRARFRCERIGTWSPVPRVESSEVETRYGIFDVVWKCRRVRITDRVSGRYEEIPVASLDEAWPKIVGAIAMLVHDRGDGSRALTAPDRPMLPDGSTAVTEPRALVEATV